MHGVHMVWIKMVKVGVGMKGEANINDKGSEKVKCYNYTRVSMK